MCVCAALYLSESDEALQLPRSDGCAVWTVSIFPQLQIKLLHNNYYVTMNTSTHEYINHAPIHCSSRLLNRIKCTKSS